MKTKDLFEADVVDLAAARKRQQNQDIERQVSVATHAWADLTGIEEWKYKFSRQNRVPGFDDIDDVLYFVGVELSAPEKQEDVEDWFSHLTEKNKAKVMMIAHHVPRMLKTIQEVMQQVKDYITRWTVIRNKERFKTELEALEAAEFFEYQLKNDMQELQRIGMLVDLNNK